MPKDKRKIVLLFGDTHAGAEEGLLNPEAKTEVVTSKESRWEPAPRLNAWQEYTWDILKRCVSEVKTLAGKDEIIPIHNGDATQGNKYKESLLKVSVRQQADLAYFNMKPWLDLPNVKKFRLIAGTASHEGFEYDGLLATNSRIQQFHPKIDTRIITHSLLNIGEAGNDILFDVAHHGPGTGGRAWLTGNVARYYLKSIVIDHQKAGEKIPDIVVRSHFHYPIHETLHKMNKWGQEQVTHLWVLPSFAGMNAYARQATKSSYTVWNGVVAVEIIGDKIINFHPMMTKIDTRTEERL